MPDPNPGPDLPDYLDPSQRMTIPDVAKRLGKHPDTIVNWIRVGVRGVRLEAFYLGACRYVSVAALERFVAALNRPTDGIPPAGLRSRNEAKAIQREADRDLEYIQARFGIKAGKPKRAK